MKKIKLISSICLLAALMFVSCDKTESSSPVSIDDSQTGTLRIYPKADLDLTKNGDELLPVGTVVNISIAYSQYTATGNGNPDGSYIASDSVNADGYVEFIVPADANGVSVIVAVNSFEYDQLQVDGTTVTKLYSFSSLPYSVYPNVFSLKELATATITSIDESVDVYDATLNLTLYTDYDKTAAGYELVPEGTQVIISNDSRDAADRIVAVDALGKISLTLPVDAVGDNFKVVVMPFVIENGINGEGEFKTVEYAKQTYYYNLVRAEVKTEDIKLLDGNFVEGYENPEMVTISGIITAELEEDKTGLEEFEGQEVTFFTYDNNGIDKNWSTTVTTNSDGKYTVEVPVNSAVMYSIVIESIERTVSEWDADDSKYVFVDKDFRLNAESFAFTSSDYDDGENDFTVSGFVEIVLP